MAHAEISVNSDILEANKANGHNDPPITVKRGDNTTQAHSVEILDEANNLVASISYLKDDEPEVRILAPTGIRINTDPILLTQPKPQTAEQGSFHLSVSDLKEA